MANDAIVVERVGKQFGTFAALTQIDLRLPAGSFLLLAGPNGAGKSTLLRLLAGLGRPTQGRVLVAGADPHSDPSARAAIGLVSHQTLLYDELTAWENLLFFARLYGLPKPQARVDLALAAAGLTSRGASRVGALSRGMKQRLALARATLHQPSVLLLDEPFSGLDQAAAFSLGQHLKRLCKEGRTGVLVTHRLDEAAPLVDHVALLRNGHLCHQQARSTGSPEELAVLYARHLETQP